MAKTRGSSKKLDISIRKNTKNNQTQSNDATTPNLKKNANKYLSIQNAEQNTPKCVVKLHRFQNSPLKNNGNKKIAVNVRQNSVNQLLAASDQVNDIKQMGIREYAGSTNCAVYFRKCCVKIQRTPSMKCYADKNLQTPSTCSLTVPVLDDEKRSKFNKLSLSKKINYFAKSVDSTEKQKTEFDPKRNSTLTELSLQSNSSSKNDSKSRHNNSSKNLTNKSDLIEEILLSNDSETEEQALANDKAEGDENLQLNVNKTTKFFHRTNNDTAQSIPVQNQKTPKRKANVYEFLSQSQTSDSDGAKPKDPTADIVQKLIEEGKVRVAHRPKGTGKPRIKAKKANTRKKQTKTQKKTKAMLEKYTQVEEEEQDANNDDFADCDLASSPIHEAEGNTPILHAQDSTRQTKQHEDGTFSNLARSVLLQQTNARRLNNRQRLLVEKARKIISTPVTNKTARSELLLTTTPHSSVALQMTNLSPIKPLTASRPGQNSIKKQTISGDSSPWRAPEHSLLPSAFHFSRGTSNLPSFSSDYIPATPEKPKHYVNKYASLDAENENLPDEPSTSKILSSFSSNDSNAENMPPAKATKRAEGPISVGVENENIFNTRQLPNPRRTLQYRSPLKPINILEVVSLPSWKDKPHSSNNSNQADGKGSSNQTKNSGSKDISIFGFEDYIESDTSPLQSITNNCAPSEVPNKTRSNVLNKSIHVKLKELSKWRPKQSEILKTSSRPITHVFDDSSSQPKQRHIKDMLCSTMIHPQKLSLPAPDERANQNIVTNNKATESSIVAELFKDIEPELTFNDEEPHNTYVRPKKRKRKLRNHFVLFMDSDCSEDEEESIEEKIGNCKKKIDKNGMNKKRRNRKDPSVERELPEVKEFCKSFNEMCKEVDEYQLIVEKST